MNGVISGVELFDEFLAKIQKPRVTDTGTVEKFVRTNVGSVERHEIVRGLKGGCTLHRFIAPGGQPYSAIYDKTGFEVWSCERSGEERMLKEWDKYYKVLTK